eukprot:gene12610-12700_t
MFSTNVKAQPNFEAMFKPQPVSGIAVQAHALSKSFGKLSVLKRLDLLIPAGQFVAIVGRSGCGKSTLLRLLAGLEQPDSGDIRLSDPAATSNAVVKSQDVARVMFQEPRLLPWADVAKNVEIGLGIRRHLPSSKSRVAQALKDVGLSERAQSWPSVLSGGQQQRVALARALVSQPRFLAFDEPLGALDALTRIEMQALLETTWRRQKFTALLVTHDVSEALALADRVILIENGTIRLDIEVDLPRPRRRAGAELVALEDRILGHLLKNDAE